MTQAPLAQSPLRLDLRGLKCPLPALKTRKALASLSPESLLAVACTDPLAAIDIPNLLRETGDVLISQEREDNAIVFTIRRMARRAMKATIYRG